MNQRPDDEVVLLGRMSTDQRDEVRELVEVEVRASEKREGTDRDDDREPVGRIDSGRALDHERYRAHRPTKERNGKHEAGEDEEEEHRAVSVPESMQWGEREQRERSSSYTHRDQHQGVAERHGEGREAPQRV